MSLHARSMVSAVVSALPQHQSVKVRDKAYFKSSRETLRWRKASVAILKGIQTTNTVESIKTGDFGNAFCAWSLLFSPAVELSLISGDVRHRKVAEILQRYEGAEQGAASAREVLSPPCTELSRRTHVWKEQAEERKQHLVCAAWFDPHLR